MCRRTSLLHVGPLTIMICSFRCGKMRHACPCCAELKAWKRGALSAQSALQFLTGCKRRLRCAVCHDLHGPKCGLAPLRSAYFHFVIGAHMKLIGIPLCRPNVSELTASSAMGTGLWVAMVGIAHAVQLQLDKSDAGALLLVVLWACISARVGIRIEKGFRHIAANLLVSAGLVVLYHCVCALAG
jgi:hypothetical protein